MVKTVNTIFTIRI